MTQTLRREAVPVGGTGASRKPTWRLQHYLAFAGVPFLVWQAWNYVAWLADGPAQITDRRDTDTAAWTGARIFEPLIVVVALIVLVWVVRGCRRAGRLTFDAQICLAGVTLLWWDPITNFYQQLFLYSSNWTNLNTWCGQAPFIVNPECGRLPEPMIFIPLVYTFGFLGGVAPVNALMGVIRRRRPETSAAALVGVAVACGALIYLILDSLMIRLNLWKWAGYPDALGLFGRGHKVPMTTILAAMTFWGTLAATRFFKDDRGRTFIERGLDHVAPGRRTLLTQFALIGFLQLVFTVTIALTVVTGPYSNDWPDYEDHLINQVCDNGNITGTPYGPCPGSPGYQAPIR
jgi:hypothetical protein